jgi:hypothetical protein
LAPWVVQEQIGLFLFIVSAVSVLTIDI